MRRARCVTVMTGAGISTAAGVPGLPHGYLNDDPPWGRDNIYPFVDLYFCKWKDVETAEKLCKVSICRK